LRLFATTPVPPGFKLRAPTSSLPALRSTNDTYPSPRGHNPLLHQHPLAHETTPTYRQANNHNAQRCRIHVRPQRRASTTPPSASSFTSPANPPITAQRAPSSKDLPPSVESAYYRKCIDLRRRITDIEDSNDGTRTRIHRLNRGIQKMRLERAFLLEALNKHMEYNVDDSDRSSSPPPTPTDKPLRSKRSHNRKGTPPQGEGEQMGMGMGGRMGMGTMNPMSSAQSTPDPGSRQQNSYFSTINAAPSATSPHTGVNGAPPPPPGQTVLPPLHSLASHPQQQAGQRQYYDPTYDEQRPDEDAGRRRAYSGAQQPPLALEGSAAPQNGDTEMTDASASAGFTSANH
jgi:hypothetical protein